MYRHRITFILLCIVICGFILRSTNLNWDAGNRIHPDEALIVNGALSIKFFSQLFSGFHDYNGLSVYILTIASLCVSYITGVLWWSVSPEGATLVGRAVSAITSTASIILVYMAGSRLWDKRIGLVAALLLAVTPLHIQLAHFYTTESLLIFFFLLLILGVISYFKSSTTRAIIQMGIPAGLLLATKNTSYFFLVLPIAALVLSKPIRWGMIRSLCIFGCVSILLFFFASPYSFIDWQGYLARSGYLKDVVSGRLLMDWTMQFQHTNGFFWLPTMALSFGPIALMGFIGSVGVALGRTTARRVDSILAWWSIGFFLFLAFTYLKFTRYLAPLLPVYALFGAKAIGDIYTSRLGRILSVVCILVQVLMGSMYASIYLTDHTSLQAADWIYRHIPNGSIIMTEEWNDIIRFDHPILATKHINQQKFNFYSLPDDSTKFDRLNALLSNTEYIILESPKVKNTILRQSSDYIYSSRWYTALEDGSLGFTHIKTFRSNPSIGPLSIPDEFTEETFTVFDHPTITIYKKASAN